MHVCRQCGDITTGQATYGIDAKIPGMKFAVIARPPVAFRKQMEQTAANPGKVVRNDGDAEGALKSAAKIVTAQYYIPHLAHASMEPPNALVNVSQGKAGTECVAFAPTQSPGGCRGIWPRYSGSRQRTSP